VLGTFEINSSPKNIDNTNTNPSKISDSIMQTSHF
jgi:hypothetical protein